MLVPKDGLDKELELCSASAHHGFDARLKI